MKLKNGLTFGVALAVCLVAVALAGQAQAGKKVAETITGKIQAAEKHRDKISAVFLEDGEQRRFLVRRGTEVGKALLSLVGQEIRATGYVGKAVRDKNFEDSIDILDYEVVQDPPAGED